MPIIKSAKKAARQAEKRRSNNQAIKKTIRAALKDFRAKPTAEKMSIVQSEYDKAVKKGLMKKNTASRRKAKLVEFAKANNVRTASAAKKTATKSETAKKPTSTTKATTAKKTTTTKKTATAKKAPAKKTTTTKKASK